MRFTHFVREIATLRCVCRNHGGFIQYIIESGLKSQIFFQEKPYIIDIQINNKFTKNYTIFYQSAN